MEPSGAMLRMNDDVEFVTATPDAAPAPSGGGAPWSPSELAAKLIDASGHVRFLLKELAGGEPVATSELASRPVAYAQVQRICRSNGKEALVLPGFAGGAKTYQLHPRYRTQVAELVADATQPPPGEKKPPHERVPKTPRLSRRARQGSALDGIADSRGTSLPAAGSVAPVRRIAQGQSGRGLAIPAEIPIEFCKELLGFINATANGARYRIILEDVGYRLEAI